MQDIKTCHKVTSSQGAFYLGESNENYSEGYLELNPQSSLELHFRKEGYENLTQVKGSCVMIIFDKPEGTTYKLDKDDKLMVEPEGVGHIHSNPFDKTSLTHWYFKGDIRKIIEDIRSSTE